MSPRTSSPSSSTGTTPGRSASSASPTTRWRETVGDRADRLPRHLRLHGGEEQYCQRHQCNQEDSQPLEQHLYQPEEVFPEDGTPEERQHSFWVPVSSKYYAVAQKLVGLKLEGCVNVTTCLTSTPRVVRVARGSNASIYVDNGAYRTFIYNKFSVTPAIMESASVALICLQQRKPFIAFRAGTKGAGEGGTMWSWPLLDFWHCLTLLVLVQLNPMRLLPLHPWQLPTPSLLLWSLSEAW